jgi:phage terminase large subunit-like protein
VREVRYDPYQLVAVAQRLSAEGLPMVEFAQSVPNLTEASSNVYELIKGRNLAVYPDAEMRLAVSRCVALETSRGWRIAKEKTSHKVDVVIALAMAALGAVRGGQTRNFFMEYITADLERMKRESGSGNGFCANLFCRKPLPADGTFWQSRGLKFCSLQCSW